MTPLAPEEQQRLETIARRTRAHVLRSVHSGQGGHVAGPLSAIDLLTALYFHTMRVDPENPAWEDRDRFILSKGHSAVALYAILAERGYFPVDELATFDGPHSRLQGHPDMTKTPGIDMSSGSLGQGISAGIGIALGARLLGKSFHTYVMLGDGESQEGQVWEAAFIAARYQIDNLTAIVDCNKLQQYGWRNPVELPPIENVAARFAAFGWQTLEIDGHDMNAIVAGLDEAKAVKGRPTVIVAHTIKGKGVSFMEGQYLWHARVPTDDELARALAELEGVRA